MSLLINLTPAEEERLSSAAIQSGLAPEELAKKIVSEYLTSEPIPTAAILRSKLRQWQKETATETYPVTSSRELFARWEKEDAEKTEEEIAADERLWQDFQKGINEERQNTGMRLLF